MLERQPSDQRQAWVDSLTLPLPGESAAVADEQFDDSYDQINR
jgi:hypothetical protein